MHVTGWAQSCAFGPMLLATFYQHSFPGPMLLATLQPALLPQLTSPPHFQLCSYASSWQPRVAVRALAFELVSHDPRPFIGPRRADATCYCGRYVRCFSIVIVTVMIIISSARSSTFGVHHDHWSDATHGPTTTVDSQPKACQMQNKQRGSLSFVVATCLGAPIPFSLLPSRPLSSPCSFLCVELEAQVSTSGINQ